MFYFMSSLLKKFAKDEKGQGMVEYGLIIALIAVVVIVGLTPLGKEIKILFDGVVTSLKPPAA